MTFEKGLAAINNAYLDEKEILFQYDDMLLGNRVNCSFVITGTEQGNRFTNAMLSYCFKHYLNWSEHDILHNLNKSYADRLLLWQFISKRIDCPSELDENDLQYVAWHLHPKLRTLSPDELAIKIYMEVLSGKRSRFPKNFFDDIDGLKRAMICFRVMVNEFIRPESVEKLYETFSNTNKAMRMLSEYRLDTASTTLFDSPFEFLNDVLIADDIDSVYYYRQYHPDNKRKGAKCR